ncbi:MAG: aspartate/glutamate racemase family protein [Chlamydiota bacterium]
MKTIGMIGGMSWESTQHYYEIMNQYIHAQLGRHNSIESILYSVNFERILELIHQNGWEVVGKELAHLAQKLEIAGADFLIMTVNTTHKVFDQIEAAITIPVLHIVDPTAKAIQTSGITSVGLIATKITMEENFYKNRLQEQYGIEVLVPEEDDRTSLHKIIFDELTVGKICDASREKLLRVIERLSKRGAKGVILGCTELTLLLHQKDTKTPLFDTTELHAKAAVDFALL